MDATTANDDEAAADDVTGVGTGDPRVDSALESLEGLADIPVERHAEVYDSIHARLREVLSGLDSDDEPA